MQGEWRPIPQVNKDTGIPALTTPEFLTKRSYSWILCAMANFYGALIVQQALRKRKEIQKVLWQKRELKKLHQEAFGRGKNPNASFCLKRSKYEIDCARYHC